MWVSDTFKLPNTKNENFALLFTLGQRKVDTFWIEYWGLIVPGWSGLLWEPPPMFGQITEVGFFEKIFCVFFDPFFIFYNFKTTAQIKNF